MVMPYEIHIGFRVQTPSIPICYHVFPYGTYVGEIWQCYRGMHSCHRGQTDRRHTDTLWQ